MMRIRAWRWPPRCQSLARWCNAPASVHYQSLQQRTISNTGTSAPEHYAHGQQSTQTGPALEEVESGLDFVESPRQEQSDLPEPEADWTLDEEAKLTIPEQEARFELFESGRYMTRIKQACMACGGSHGLWSCPYVFIDNPMNYFRPKKTISKFEKRMHEDPEFRGAVEYLRKTFTNRTIHGRPFSVSQSMTQDAPPLAKVWLSNFDDRVAFHGTKADRVPLKIRYKMLDYFFFPGHFATTDDDGRPFLILFTQNGHMDETLPYEIDMIRTFVARYNKGEKTMYEKTPELDVRPIGVVILTRRWHVPTSSIAAGTPAITVGIASEYSWYHGYARWGIHVKAEAGKVENGYWGWSCGRPTELGPNSFVDWNADTASKFTGENTGWVAGLGNALLRDVREPIERISGDEDAMMHWDRILHWRRTLLHRAATFYGTSSPQYRLLWTHAGLSGDVEARTPDAALAAVPQWKHIQARIAMAGKSCEEETIWRSIFR